MLKVKDFVLRKSVYRQASRCRVIKLDFNKDATFVEVNAKVICFRPSGSGKPHNVKVVLFDLGRPFRERRVQVQCDCPDFVYRCEYALAKKKAASLERALPAPPRETNPRMKPWICKHVAVVLEKMTEVFR